MARKISQTDPALAIEFFLSGFYTHRSQLFAPFKGIGVNVVSFHDPVLDGNNMEDTDLYEWSRRPGFSIFCSQPLPDTEIVNQFYSSRLLTGVVVPWVDTNRRWASFSSTAITTIATKTTTNQGYPSTVGQMTYFADGAAADYYKYDSSKLSAWGLAAPTITPVASGLGFWQADTQYALGNTILDTNGCIESVTAILIPNGSIESPTYEATKALAGSLPLTWAYDPENGGYFVQTGYRVVQSGNSQSTTSTVTYTFPTPVAAGDTVVLVFGQGTVNYTPTVVSVTDNLGTVYAQQTTATGTYSGGGNNYPSTAWVWTGTVGVTGTCTITVQTSSVAGSNLFLLAHEISGINPIAVTAVNNFGVNVGTLNTGTVGFSSTALVLSSMLAFTTGGTVPPAGFTESETVSEGEWSLTDSYEAVTSPQTSVWTIPAANGQVLGFSLVFQIPSLATGYSPYLFLGSLNFAIPTGAQILGILVNMPKMNSGLGTVVDNSVRLVVGGSIVGNDYASAATWSTSGYSSAVYGGPADKWGLTPSAAQINANGATGFGIAISANITSTTGGSVVPEVGFSGANMPTITIYYRQANGLGGPGVSGSTEPIWPTYTSGVVNDGGLTWTNYGAIQTWFPATGYPTPVVILDPNGFLQLSTYLANPIAEWDSSTDYSLGNIVYFGGQYWISVFNGTNTDVVPTVAYATTGSSTTVPYWALTTTPLVTGLTAPVWNTTIGGTTTDGSYTWTNIGQGTGLAFTGYAYVYGYRTIYGHLTTASPYSNNTGAILGPLNGTITSYAISGNVVTFTGDNNFIPGNVFTATGLMTGTYLNDQAFTVTSAIPSSSFPLTSVGVSGDVLTIAATNNLVAGQTVTFSGVGTATFLNGITVTVLSSGLSGSQFEANLTHTNYGPTADTGTVVANGSYTAAFTYPNVSLTLDSGAALPLISTITGNGTASPLCNSTASITAVSVAANIVTITASNNFQPGLWITLTGLTNATFLNNQQLEVIAVDQLVGTQNTYFQVYFETPNYAQTADTGTATFNAIEIYRTSDGGGTYLFAGAVTNPGTGEFIFNDFVPDANLDIELIAALGHQNDPPPGAPGSVITMAGSFLSYWQNRFWMAVGNYVYFDAGPDCTNGIPAESWPPGNRFQFAGPVLGTSPSADGTGLLVYLADRVNVIMGGPETISFYPDDALNNFGISNPNALFKDGSIIGQFTTQKQYFELIGKEKQEIGEHIADYLTTNFAPASSYITMHRNGLDVGVFISNGVDRIVRYGSNISAWSVPAFPACGAGALRSIETSVGIMSLMLASPTGGVTATIGSVNPTSGTSVGTGVAWANPSNITVGSPTSYATVTFSGAATSQILRAASYTLPAAYNTLAIPVTAVVQGIQVTLVGTQSTPAGLTITITPTNAVAGAESHTFTFGPSNTTVTFGGMLDLWGMPWNTPNALNGQQVSFDITATYTGLGSPDVSIAEVQLAVTYQNPGNYLYARDVNSWGDCGTFGDNNGQPYPLCNVVIGSITLSQPGARLFPLQHVVGYFDAVGTLDNGKSSQPDIWILPNEISDTKGIGFVYLPEIIQEPPIGQNVPSTSLLALRWPVNMMNSALASQFVHHLQVKVQFEPENAPNTIKAIAFMEDQTT